MLGGSDDVYTLLDDDSRACDTFDPPQNTPAGDGPRTWQSRTFGPLERGAQRASVWTLASSAIGAGALTLPYAMAQMGILPGFCMLLLFGLGAFIGMLVIANGMKHYNVDSFPVLVEKSVGRRVVYFTDFLIGFNGIGICASCVIFVADFIPSAFKAMNFPMAYCSRTLVILFTVISALPFSWKRRISSLRYVALIPTVALSVTCAILVIVSPMEIMRQNRLQLRPELPLARCRWGMLKYLNLFGFAFMQHLSVYPVIREMNDPSERRVFKALARVVSVELILYVVVALCGVVTFGIQTKQNFLQNYPQDSPPITLCRLLLAASLLSHVPLDVLPALDSIIHGLEGVVPLLLPSGSTRWGINNSGSQHNDPLTAVMDSDASNIFRRQNSKHDSNIFGDPISTEVGTEQRASGTNTDSEEPNWDNQTSKNGPYNANTDSQNVSNRIPGVANIEEVAFDYADTSGRINDRMKTNLTHSVSQSSVANVSCIIPDSQNGRDSSYSFSSMPFRRAVVTVMLLIVALIALLTDQVAVILSIVGGLYSAAMMYLFPAIIQMKICEGRNQSEQFCIERLQRDFLFFCYALATISVAAITLPAIYPFALYT